VLGAVLELVVAEGRSWDWLPCEAAFTFTSVGNPRRSAPIFALKTFGRRQVMKRFNA
jgi:hypothetical protein